MASRVRMRMQMFGRKYPQGAEVTSNGVHYRVWAPRAAGVVVRITPADGSARALPLAREADGYHSRLDCSGVPGDRYLFDLVKGGLFPCPASRYQPDARSGPSIGIDPNSFPGA